jgi:hypothetical protein
VRADYQVNQTINSSLTPYNLSTPEGEKAFVQSLRDNLAPDLVDLVLNERPVCSNGSCTISYNVSYRGFANPDPTRIANYIEDRTKAYGSPPSVTKTNSNQDKRCLKFYIFIFSLIYR